MLRRFGNRPILLASYTGTVKLVRGREDGYITYLTQRSLSQGTWYKKTAESDEFRISVIFTYITVYEIWQRKTVL